MDTARESENTAIVAHFHWNGKIAFDYGKHKYTSVQANIKEVQLQKKQMSLGVCR